MVEENGARDPIMLLLQDVVNKQGIGMLDQCVHVFQRLSTIMDASSSSSHLNNLYFI
jgi:hypothetical protein